ncbi:hypothetical protein MKZ38_009754 [Zalerion maritima]|uniref:Glycoside hydrolase family 71 protein n=1 Tax=Zalerion maritima TaxID=339359 RepID=A0AAD5RT10_9PEZI|nr:hypothetical protein MKZ38_009754 [Zalerion maritima]
MIFPRAILSSLGLVAGSMAAASGKPVFAHYMIGGISEAHCQQDVQDALDLGLDAFALNFDQFASWSNATVDYLFDAADDLGFGLFFSFDMSGDYFSDPSEYAAYLLQYTSRGSYFLYSGTPLVSTFGDGVFNWDSWPAANSGNISVPTSGDETYLSAASANSKLFMMGISPLQFKHISSSTNWYRRGESNLEVRLGQALSLQPDMLEIQTWNDGGESHYVGNLWKDPFEGSTAGEAIWAYAGEYHHAGYQEILKSFIRAWKAGDEATDGMVPTNGEAAQGVFWHHTLTVDGDCAGDDLGKPGGIDDAEDRLTAVVLVQEGQSGLYAIAWSGPTELGQVDLVEGYNSFFFGGMTPGIVTVEVWQNDAKILGASGPIQMTDSSSICNYNFQVVALEKWNE